MNEQTVNMKKNVIWNTFGSVFYCACQWLITILVVHVSSYEAAGYLGIAMTMSSSFSAISLFSMRNYQVSDVKGEYSTNEYVGSRIWTCVVALVCCAVAAVWGNSVYQMLCIDAFMLVRVAEAVVDVMHGVNQNHDRYDLIGKSYILRGIATVASFSIGLAATQNMVLTLAIMAVLNLILAFGFDWNMTGRLETIKPVLIHINVWNLLKRCIPIVIFTFLLSLENLIPKTVLSHIAGEAEVGIYSSIASPTLVVQVFASVAFNPFLPRLSEAYYVKDYRYFHKMLRTVYAALLGMSVVVTIGAALLGRWGLSLLLTEDILQYYNLFMPIVWCTILTAFVWILSAVIVAIRQIKAMLVGMLADFLLCLIFVNPCVQTFGKNGVSIVQLIVLTIYVLYMIAICEVTIYKDKKREKNEKISNHTGL